MKTHTATYRVYYEDTDAGGVVYYANFLKFAERARTDFMRLSGYNHFELAAKLGVFFVVRRAEVTYHKPGRLDDLITVETTITKTGSSSVDMDQIFFNQNGQKLAEAFVQIVCVANKGNEVKSTKMPEEIKKFFS
jgi:acyl-CoA thioester hydrolase